MRRFAPLILVAGLAWSIPADAQQYSGSLAAGVGQVDYTFTTDGALGPLQYSDITAYTIAITNGADRQSFDQTNGAFIDNGPSQLSATPTDLSYNFSGGTQLDIVRATGPYEKLTFYYNGGPGLLSYDDSSTGSQSVTENGVQSFASVGGPAAPAPLAGVGLLPALAALAGLGATRLGWARRFRRAPAIG